VSVAPRRRAATAQPSPAGVVHLRAVSGPVNINAAFLRQIARVGRPNRAPGLAVMPARSPTC